jgi:hypothetical protein
MLATFRESPGLAYRRYVTKTEPDPRPSPSMVIGSAVNHLVLDPASAPAGFYVVQVRTRDAKAYRDAEQAYPERLILTLPEHELAMRAADSILEPLTSAAEVAHALLTAPGGISEWAYQWDDASGVPCKLMVDRLLPLSGRPTIGELKTARDPGLLVQRYGETRPASWLYNLGYDQQAAFNRRGVRHALGSTVEPDFYFVAVRNSSPYDVHVAKAGETFLSRAEAKTGETLARLAECLASPGPAGWISREEGLPGGVVPVLEEE